MQAVTFAFTHALNAGGLRRHSVFSSHILAQTLMPDVHGFNRAEARTLRGVWAAAHADVTLWPGRPIPHASYCFALRLLPVASTQGLFSA